MNMKPKQKHNDNYIMYTKGKKIKGTGKLLNRPE